MAELKSKRDNFTKTLSLLRKEVKIATNILEDNDEIKHNMKTEKAMQQKRFITKQKKDIGMMTYADKENFMKKYITDENTGISYTLVGDVYIPNLVSTDMMSWVRKMNNIRNRTMKIVNHDIIYN